MCQRVGLSSTGGKMLLSLVLVLLVQGKSLDKFADDPVIISRSEWGANEAKTRPTPLTVNPPLYVIIHHASSDICTNRAICQARIRTFQDYHMKTKNWSDIGYNFLVGEDGNIYEGRGWGISGAHTKNYNEKSIGICVIGNYENRLPNAAASEAVKNLIAYGVSSSKINKNYTLIGHKQAWTTTHCPGDKLYQLIQTWSNWVNNTL